MPRNTKQHSKQFKLDVITYRKEHPDLTQAQCAKNLGIGVSTLARWEQQFRNSDGDIPVRRSQYVSNAWREATEKMQRSYSHTGYPYDNACIESFHSLIKREWLNRFSILNYEHAYRLIFEYIESFYNTVRIHSHCDYMSPDEFEKLYERAMLLPAA